MYEFSLFSSDKNVVTKKTILCMGRNSLYKSLAYIISIAIKITNLFGWKQEQEITLLHKS